MAAVTARKRNGSNTWEYRIELAQVDGKRKQKSKGGFRTKTEAIKAGNEALHLYENGGNPVIEKAEMSVSDLFDLWLDKYGKDSLKDSTIQGYEKKLRLYIKPAIGQYRVKAINRILIQDFITKISNDGLSKNTVSSIRGIITGCFDWAEMNRIIPQSHVYKIRLPKKTTTVQNARPHHYLEKSDMDKIFERFPEGSSGYLPIFIGYHCGLRIGETFALVWEDIDFENKTLTVNRQVQWMADKSKSQADKSKSNGKKEAGNGYWYFSDPKYDSFRTITIDDELVTVLKREKEKQEKAEAYYAERYSHYYAENDILATGVKVNNRIGTDQTNNPVHFVMRREDGSYINLRTSRHVARVIHYDLGIETFDYHSLRHTHSTMLQENGAPMVYIQERLGHVDIDTTKKVYTNHLTETLQNQGNGVLGSMF